MKKPLFQTGEQVLHIAKRKHGLVVDRFHDGNGYRYYVKIGAVIWSVPEAGLDSKNAQNAHQGNQQVAGAKILDFAGAREKRSR